MIRLIVADDHKLFREGLSSLLSKDEDFEVAGMAENGKELLALLKDKPDTHIVLLDISMPEMDGFEVLSHAKKRFPSTKFIAISMHADGQYIAKCVRLGAYGYLLKNTDEEELIQAINTVFDGKKYFPAEISALMINNMSIEGNTAQKLSQREMEILELVSNGKTTKEIAEELIISTRTVETHRVNMMKKLEVQNTAELIKKAAHMKLI